MEAVSLSAMVRGVEDIPSIKAHTVLSKVRSPRCLHLRSSHLNIACDHSFEEGSISSAGDPGNLREECGSLNP